MMLLGEVVEPRASGKLEEDCWLGFEAWYSRGMDSCLGMSRALERFVGLVVLIVLGSMIVQDWLAFARLPEVVLEGDPSEPSLKPVVGRQERMNWASDLLP